MRTSALALASALPGKLAPFLKCENDNQPSPYLTTLGDGPYMTSCAAPRPALKPVWESIKDWLMLATHMTYGGTGITTNRLNGGGTTPLNGGWGLNPGALTTSITDTALFDPSAEARVAGTFSQQTTTYPNDTAQVIVTIQASAARAITEFGLFDTATAAPQTTLAATVSNSGAQTVFSVGSTTNFSNAGFIQVDSEVCSITSSSAGNLTVGRAARGSTGATHASGANVVGGEALAGGNMFMKGDFAVINLNNGDSIQFTAKTTYVPQ